MPARNDASQPGTPGARARGLNQPGNPGGSRALADMKEGV